MVPRRKSVFGLIDRADALLEAARARGA